MNFSDKAEHALIAVYDNSEGEDVAGAILSCITGRDIKILTPGDRQTLGQAAQNSVLVFIAITGSEDPNLNLGNYLQENRLVSSDVIAFCLEGCDMSHMQIMGKGFDGCVSSADSREPEFKNFLKHKIISGSKRLAGLILEEEHRRICDALSSSPASTIIFDAEKRAVFVSDHYFRAYPKIATRLIRGLSVYDAFDLIIKEDNILSKDERFEKLQKFWSSLDGSIEYTLDNGTSYRLKAVQLPGKRGTVVIGQKYI